MYPQLIALTYVLVNYVDATFIQFVEIMRWKKMKTMNSHGISGVRLTKVLLIVQ